MSEPRQWKVFYTHSDQSAPIAVAENFSEKQTAWEDHTVEVVEKTAYDALAAANAELFEALWFAYRYIVDDSQAEKIRQVLAKHGVKNE